jgi:hypothetical protein
MGMSDISSFLAQLSVGFDAKPAPVTRATVFFAHERGVILCLLQT